MTADGLLFAYTDPGRVPLEEFNDWYDNEHGPARLTVAGISAGYRYRAADGQAPPWLALYFMTAGALDSPEYKALGASASAREKSVLSRIATLDRRVYQRVSSDGPDLDGPAPAVMLVSISVPAAVEDDDKEDDQGDEDNAQHVGGRARPRRVYRLRGGEEHDDDPGSDPRQS